MHRGITLSCAASKLFESVLLTLFGDSMHSDDLQFGFKNNTVVVMLFLCLMSLCNISLDVAAESTVPP